MTNATRNAATEAGRMDSVRKTALVAGVLYLITFAASIPALFLLDPVLNDPAYILGAGPDGQVRLGILLDIVNALACIGTAVVLFSLLRRQHEGLALGFVTTRLFEAAVIVIGVVSLLAVVTLRDTGAAVATADAPALVIVGQSLVTVRDWTFVLGPGMAAFNALLLGTLLYRSRLVPRAIAAIGLIGAPVYLSFVIGVVLGVTGEGSVWQLLGVAPMFIWELSVGLWMVFKGFDRSSPLLAGTADQAATPSGPAMAIPSHGPIATSPGPA